MIFGIPNDLGIRCVELVANMGCARSGNEDRTLGNIKWSGPAPCHDPAPAGRRTTERCGRPRRGLRGDAGSEPLPRSREVGQDRLRLGRRETDEWHRMESGQPPEYDDNHVSDVTQRRNPMDCRPSRRASPKAGRTALKDEAATPQEFCAWSGFSRNCKRIVGD